MMLHWREDNARTWWLGTAPFVVNGPSRKSKSYGEGAEVQNSCQVSDIRCEVFGFY
jgi:hypothetical protein